MSSSKKVPFLPVACCCCISLRHGVIGIILLNLSLAAYTIISCVEFISKHNELKELFALYGHAAIKTFEAYRIVYLLGLGMATVSCIVNLFQIPTIFSRKSTQCLRYKYLCLSWIIWKILDVGKSFLICILMALNLDSAVVRPFVIMFLVLLPFNVWSVLVMVSYFQTLNIKRTQTLKREIRVSGDHIKIKITDASSDDSSDIESTTQISTCLEAKSYDTRHIDGPKIRETSTCPVYLDVVTYVKPEKGTSC